MRTRLKSAAALAALVPVGKLASEVVHGGVVSKKLDEAVLAKHEARPAKLPPATEKRGRKAAKRLAWFKSTYGYLPGERGPIGEETGTCYMEDDQPAYVLPAPETAIAGTPATTPEGL